MFKKIDPVHEDIFMTNTLYWTPKELEFFISLFLKICGSLRSTALLEHTKKLYQRVPIGFSQPTLATEFPSNTVNSESNCEQ